MQKIVFILIVVVCVTFYFVNRERGKVTYEEEFVVEKNKVHDFFESGNVKFELGDYQGAVEEYSRVIDIEPRSFSSYLNRGVTKYNLQDYWGAISDFTIAIEFNPKYAEAYFNRGVVKIALGDKNGACSDWHKVEELGYPANEVIKEHCN